MAMAMAAWSLGPQLSVADNTNSFRALEKTICIAPSLKASSGFVATKPCCIVHKRR